MANLQGFGVASVGNMINHYTRHRGDENQERYRYANQKIDKSRTHLNYALFERDDPEGFVASFIDKADVKPKGGDRCTNVLSNWVFTLPGNPALAGREREFFEAVLEYMMSIIPEELIVGAWVHMDETTPHMHLALVPFTRTPVMTNDKSAPLRWTKADERKNPKHKAGEVKRDKKGTVRYKRVQARGEDGEPVWQTSFAQTKIFDKAFLSEFHPKLEAAMEDRFGFVVGIQLEDEGERQLSRLGQREYVAAKKTLERLGDEVEKTAASASYYKSVAESAKEQAVSEIEKVRDAKAELVKVGQASERQLQDATKRLSDIEREIVRETERLECLRREGDGAAGRVERLESIAADVREFDHASRGGKSAILGRIADKAEHGIKAITTAIERVRCAIAELLSRQDVRNMTETGQKAYSFGSESVREDDIFGSFERRSSGIAGLAGNVEAAQRSASQRRRMRQSHSPARDAQRARASARGQAQSIPRRKHDGPSL